MERVVLATLRWDVAAVTPQDFIPHFLLTLGELKDGETHTGDFLGTLRRHSDTLVAMCVCDSRFLGIPPSLVAAAVLNSALRGLRTKSVGELSVMSSALATLCQTDVVSEALVSVFASMCLCGQLLTVMSAFIYRPCCSAALS